jgi:hypothetical protein
MSQEKLTRRDFNALTAAAVGGLVAGTVAGCTTSHTDQAPPAGGTGNSSTTRPVAAGEKHVCRGLNACKGQGAGGTNACAGQGACATASHHACGGLNDCKGQGGCGETAGENACKGMGGCHVPLGADKWDKVREKFEAKMQAAGKQVGPPPPPSG